MRVLLRSAFVLLPLLGCSARAVPQSLSSETIATATALRDGAMKGTRAYELVRSLTVETGPRLAGSPGDKAGVEWGVRTLKELGFQNVRAEKVTVPHWVRGAESGEIVSPWPQPVVLAALGGSVGTPEGGIEAEVVMVPDVAALEGMDPAKVKGRIVFVNKRMRRAKDGSGYGEAVVGRGRGATLGGKLGAAAVLIRSVGTDNNRTPHTGAMRYEEGTPRIPAAALSNPDADILETQIDAAGKARKPVRFRLKLGARYLPDAESANVIGEIPGREKPEEIVLLGCHLDSWDLGTGAVDDAAGCAIMMEAARRIGELPQRPRRTVRVVLFANEEFGLSGARAYAEKYAADLPRHILAGESDFGSGRVWQVDSRVAPESLPLFDEIAKLLAPIGAERGDNQSGGGADLSPLIPARVPVVGLNQDGTYYFDWHHTANDTLDKIDAKDLDQNVAAWAAVAYAAAEMSGSFGQAPELRPRQ
ncbi:MAG TPA: M20/M25/M40 family metallo-hydrolase [Thermoanaerobaculia bacterium]|nr:M20/M25/M40 family metallo-hydrolase [Thermoanaerobaculia bacterium]